MTDERIKELYGSDDIIKAIAKINAFKFDYKKEAQDKEGADDKTHVGVMAQELEKNPLTSGAVKTNDEGDKMIDGGQLATTDLALITELARRVLELENRIAKLEK